MAKAPTYTLRDDGRANVVLERDAVEPMALFALEAARRKSTITYGRAADLLASRLGVPKIFATQVGFVAGTMMDRLLEASDHEAPLLNVLVVGQDTGLPGKGITGYFKDRFGSPWDRYMRLSLSKRAEICSRAAGEVYAYEDWDGLFLRAFGCPPPAIAPLPALGEADGKSPDGRRGGTAESPEHKALKHYVQQSPGCVGRGLADAVAVCEHKLLSGDEVDVCLTTPNRIVVVEVKSRRSNYDDLRRGVYQCVKYQAVMAAQQDGMRNSLAVEAVLVTETGLPDDLRNLARRLGIKTIVVSV